MKITRFAGVLGTLALGLVGAFALASPAQAQEPQVHAVRSDCHTGWYTNPDEGDRRPEQVAGGFEFGRRDLVHHEAGFPLKDLTVGGSFVADPDPGPDFRFSVEIMNLTPDTDGKSGYATLHWQNGKWFIGGADASAGQYAEHEADPENFIGKTGRYGVISADSQVVSFGVGYTNSPAGEKTVVVSSISFRGVTYELGCREVVPAVPTGTDATCADPEGSLNIPADTDKVSYTVEPAFSGPGTYKVTAQVAHGYFFMGGVGEKVWHIEVNPAEGCETAPPTTEPPTSESPSPDPNGSPSPSPSGDVNVPPTGTPTASPSQSPSATPDVVVPAGNEKPSGGLPLTGNFTRLLLVLGLVVIAVGVSLFFAVRRSNRANRIEFEA